MNGKPVTLSVSIALVVLLAGASAVQAFSFCSSFGGGQKSRSHFYGYPPPATGFGRGVYYGYPYSPVYPAPLYRPYYPPPPPGIRGGRPVWLTEPR